MSPSLVRKALAAGLGSAAALVVVTGFAGCGGSSNTMDDAVVVTAPGTNIPAEGSGAAAPAASTSSSAAPAPAATSGTSAPATTPVKAEGWGTLKGQVVFGSNPPDQPDLVEKGKAPKDPETCAKIGPIKSERLVVDGATKGVKNVLVYLSKPTAVNDEAKAGASKAQVEFDQKNCVFEPHVLGVMTGAEIELKSSDPVNHNVNARLKNTPFNSILAPGSTTPFKPALSERTPAPVTCDIHPWMQAWWLVLDHPYFTVTDDKGNFELKNVPAGTQKVVVWQEAAGFVSPTSGEDVTIKANDATTKSFTVDPSKVKPGR
jgi:plastocyanin